MKACLNEVRRGLIEQNVPIVNPDIESSGETTNEKRGNDPGQGRENKRGPRFGIHDRPLRDPSEDDVARGSLLRFRG